MRRYLLIATALILVVACGKDKLATKPSIKLKSTSGSFIPNGGGLTAELEFADKEGDISNTLFIQKIRTNKKVVPTIRDTFSLEVAEFNRTSRGNLRINLSYQNHLVSAINPPNLGGNPPVYEDDSLIIRFVLRDLGGNVSDTVSTSAIVVSRN
jgi:hypothetical protein